MPAKRSLLQDKSGNHRNNRKNQHAAWNRSSSKVTAEDLESCIAQPLRAGQFRKRRTVGTDIGESSPDIHGAQGGNERRYVELCNNDAIDHAHQRSQKNGDQDDHRNTEV